MFFDTVPQGAPDPVFGLLGAYQTDPRPCKMSLMVGTFKDELLRNPILSSVSKVKWELGPADYLPIDGLESFYQSIGKLCFGTSLWERNRERIYGAQAVGGTGALRVGAEFLAQEVGRNIWIPQPTWPNHRAVFHKAGLMVETLPYYNAKVHAFDRDAYFKTLETLKPKSIVLFHATCHNPTGSDPTPEDWRRISELCKKNALFPFFDFAYQGFGKGLEEDAGPIRLFLERGHEMLIAYSCSKNFSLYSYRVGALFAVGLDPKAKERVGSQIKKIIRALYSNPPSPGAKIVAGILGNRELSAEWQEEVDGMRKRITEMRNLLVDKLTERSSRVDFRFVLQHKGMFSYLDLTPSQVKRLMEEFGIYTLDQGRINVAGLTAANIDYFADSLIKVCDS